MAPILFQDQFGPDDFGVDPIVRESRTEALNCKRYLDEILVLVSTGRQIAIEVENPQYPIVD